VDHDGASLTVPEASIPAELSLRCWLAPPLTHLFQPKSLSKQFITIISQFLAMDASARETMKDAAKCDKHCEWQNLVNQ
jgi:hypothetical protein